MFDLRGSRPSVRSRTSSYSVLSYALLVGSPRTTIRLIMEKLAEDLRQLTDLARENLPYDQLDLLGLNHEGNEPTLLHGKEHSVAAALSQHGVSIQVMHLPPPHVTVYHDENMNVQTANELWAHGFRAIDILDAWGCTPLVIACKYSRGRMVRWFLDKGAEAKGPEAVGFPQRGLRSCLHVVAAEVWLHGNLLHYHDTLEALNQACGPTLTDYCTCYCSSHGCLPVNLLIKRRRQYGSDSDWWRTSQKLRTWFDLSRINSSEEEACYSELCRLEIFERLGMAHTCCESRYIQPDRTSYLIPSVSHLARGEWSKLREAVERAGLVRKLQAYMQLYKRLRANYPEPISRFWKAWWRTLSDTLPERRWIWDSNACVEVVGGSNNGTWPDEKVSEGASHSCRLDEVETRSRMEFFLGGGGLALMEDVFSEKERA